MKKLIYICVFNSSKYVEMLFLLLESIYLFGRIDEETDIMIYTSTEFKNIIEQSEYHRSNIKYRINDDFAIGGAGSGGTTGNGNVGYDTYINNSIGLSQYKARGGGGGAAGPQPHAALLPGVCVRCVPVSMCTRARVRV